MLIVHRQNFELTGNRPLPLHPVLPASTLRGALGNALFQLAALDEPGEPSRVAWLTAETFGPAVPSTDGMSPRPMVLRARFTRPDRRAAHLECLLFGSAARCADVVHRAMDIVADMGIGQRSPVRCFVRKLRDERVTPGFGALEGDAVLACFQTPTRLGGIGQRTCGDGIPFPILAARGLDRLQALCNRYGDGVSTTRDWDMPGLKRAAHDIVSAVVDGGYAESRRISGRTGESVSLSGFVGRMLYRGDLRPFLPLFDYLPWIHVGRGTPHGGGEVDVLKIPAS